MKKRGVRSIDGSKGGLPIWLEAAKAIADAGLVGTLESPVEWATPDGFVEQIDTFGSTETTNWYYTEDNPFFDQRLHRVFAPMGQPRELLNIDESDTPDIQPEKKGLIPTKPPRFGGEQHKAPAKDSSFLDWLFGDQK